MTRQLVNFGTCCPTRLHLWHSFAIIRAKISPLRSRVVRAVRCQACAEERSIGKVRVVWVSFTLASILETRYNHSFFESKISESDSSGTKMEEFEELREQGKAKKEDLWSFNENTDQNTWESSFPGVELHNHFPGILAPEKLIELAFDNDPAEFLRLVFRLYFKRYKNVQTVFKLTNLATEKQVVKFPTPNEEQARNILEHLKNTDTTIPQEVDNPVDYVKQYVQKNSKGSDKSRALKAAFGRSGLKPRRERTVELSYKNQAAMQTAVATLLTANELISFKFVYQLRALVIQKIPVIKFYDTTLNQLKEDEVKYGEVQGSLPNGISPEKFRQLLNKYSIDLRFLTMVPSDALAKAPTRTREIAGKKISPAEWVTNRLDNAGVVGVDFAGEEAKFSEEGMQFFREVYLIMTEKAERQNCYFVLRPHVGEGVAERTAKGVSEKSSHREWASKNIQHVLDTLKLIKKEGKWSERVVVRFGHATHATPEQLEEIKELGIIVEANLGSNLATKSVGSEFERDQVILKFLYHGVRTILNTDAGGVMMTTLQNEYDAVETIIENFKAGRISMRINNRPIKYTDLPKEKQKNFDIQRLIRDLMRIYPKLFQI